MIKNRENTLTGIIRMHARGFGFVIPDDKNNSKEDVFIPQSKTHGAVEGDHVKILYFQGRNPEKGPEGEVLSILQRSRSRVAGTLVEKIGKDKWNAYIPLLGNEREMIVEVLSGANSGDRMIFEVTSWGGERKAAKGREIERLGAITDPSCDIRAAVEEFELIHTFPKEVEKEVAAFASKVSVKESRTRVDFTKLETFTIDPDESKDFDDALSLEKNKKGYILYVHIADVSHYVKPGSALDKAAFSRANSVYLPGTVIPMLPPELSNNLCSLKPNVKRLTVSVVIHLDNKGVLQDFSIVKSVIKSQKRFTYREAKAVLDGEIKSPHAKTLELMVKLCGKLKEQRALRGAVEFAMPDLSIKVDNEGLIKEMQFVEYDITHQLVEEFMLKANELVAKTLSEQKKPLTYRIHEKPNQDKMKDFAAYARSFGFKLSDAPTSEELQALFDQARESSFGKSLTTAFIKSMKLASYSTQNIGHYGLMLEFYTHFTSPIRRYVDLIVHQLLFDEADPTLNHEKMALQCSEKERIAAKAESSVTYLKKLRYLKQKLEEEPTLVLDAVITAIKPFGITFEIPSLFMDGFLPMHELERYQHYRFFKKRGHVSSQGRNSDLSSGSEIQVQVAYIDLITRTSGYCLYQKNASSKKKTPRK